MNTNKILEFNIIKETLANFALSESGKNKALSLEPTLSEKECRKLIAETTEAKKVLESLGNPPLPIMDNLDEIITVVKAGGMLIPEQLVKISQFLTSSRQVKNYLKRAEFLNVSISYYSDYISEISELREEIEKSIRGDMIDDSASSELKNIRRKIDNANIAIKAKLDSLLKSKKEWFADSYVTTRQGRFVVPVKKEFKNQISGSVIEISNTGGTYFIEPTSIRKLQDEINLLKVEEENEIIKILYTLTSLVETHLSEIENNKNYFEILDFKFAKAKMSVYMKANEINLTTNREIKIVNGRHPLIEHEICVPLNFEIGGEISGVVITGANTGGKTVSLKTIGLLSLMAQSGLHVPADSTSIFTMNVNILCDIGDGQSITENLSTFSSHIKNVIEILENTTSESLVLLDELGSGTDPAEGMGLAVAILEELLEKNCLFVATSHYSEVKSYAQNTAKLINARMEFNRETLQPLYQLQIGEAGESCAFYIAQKLGLNSNILERAHKNTYGEFKQYNSLENNAKSSLSIGKIKKAVESEKSINHSDNFGIGDSVMVLPNKEIGIVFNIADKMGNIGVQVKKEKFYINHKRIKLIAKSEELYPDDYDFSIIFDTVENRKARHEMERGKQTDLTIKYD